MSAEPARSRKPDRRTGPSAASFLLSIALLLASVARVPASVSFPMQTEGVLGAWSFFEQDEEHFIYGEIGAKIRVLSAGDFSWRLGMDITTFMGKNRLHPDMKFNIYHAHWNLKIQFDYRIRSDLLLLLYSDHECYHNIDTPDSTSQYLNNIKLGAEYQPDRIDFQPRPTIAPGPWPDAWIALGIYRPKGESFQKGHDFDWSIQLGVDQPLVGWRSYLFGLRYEPSFYFHMDGDASSRHLLETYVSCVASAGSFEAYLAWVPRDTQPMRPIDGRAYWGIRFNW